jgi:hypothetical protein
VTGTIIALMNLGTMLLNMGNDAAAYLLRKAIQALRQNAASTFSDHSDLALSSQEMYVNDSARYGRSHQRLSAAVVLLLVQWSQRDHPERVRERPVVIA